MLQEAVEKQGHDTSAYVYSVDCINSILYRYGCSRCCRILYILNLDCVQIAWMSGNQEILFAYQVLTVAEETSCVKNWYHGKKTSAWIVSKTRELEVQPSRSSITTYCRDWLIRIAKDSAVLSFNSDEISMCCNIINVPNTCEKWIPS